MRAVIKHPGKPSEVITLYSPRVESVYQVLQTQFIRVYRHTSGVYLLSDDNAHRNGLFSNFYLGGYFFRGPVLASNFDGINFSGLEQEEINSMINTFDTAVTNADF